MSRARRAVRALVAIACVLALAVSGCGLLPPSPQSVKANAQQARKAVDDIVYYDVEFLLVPTVVMRTTEGTAVVTTKQATDMQAWLRKDLAVVETSAAQLRRLPKGSMGDSTTDQLLADTSEWLDTAYLPAIRAAIGGVAAGDTLKQIETDLGAPWVGSAGEAAKRRIGALRTALAKKTGG